MYIYGWIGTGDANTEKASFFIGLVATTNKYARIFFFAKKFYVYWGENVRNPWN